MQILQSFSVEEFRLAAKFIKSPVHNRHEKVIKLFNFLRKKWQKQHKIPSKIEVFQHLFPDEKTINLKRLHHVNSYLFQVLEEFLAWSEWKKDKFKQHKNLLDAYNNHNLSNFFESTSKSTLQHLVKNADTNVHFHRQHFELEMTIYNFNEKQGRLREFNLQTLSDTQDIDFIANKLRSACMLLSHEAIIKKAYDKGCLPYIISYIDTQKELLKIPTIRVYYFAYQSIHHPDNRNAFSELKQMLLVEHIKLPISELKNIYLIALNYAIRKWNESKVEFLREMFDLYKGGLASHVFLDKQLLSRYTYSNIVAVALELKEYNWTKNFIHEYRPKLAEKYREGFFHYNLARYYYEIKNFEEAMPLLLQREYSDELHNLTSRTLLARMYYELDEIDALDNLLSSFYTYLNRKKNLGYHRQINLNTISYFKRLIALPPNDRKEKNALKNDLEKETKIVHKKWFLEQLS